MLYFAAGLPVIHSVQLVYQQKKGKKNFLYRSQLCLTAGIDVAPSDEIVMAHSDGNIDTRVRGTAED